MKKLIYQNLEKIKNYNIYLNQNFIIFKLINQIWWKIWSDFDFLEEIIYNYIGNFKEKSYLKYFYYIFLIISGFIIYIFYLYLFLFICLIFYSYIIFFFKFFFKEILLTKYPNNKLYLDILNIINKLDNIIYYFWINYPEYISNIKAILYYIFTGRFLLDFIRLKILDPIDYFLYKCLMKIEYIIKKIINIIDNIDNYIEYYQYLWNKFKFKINQIKNIILNILLKFDDNYGMYLPTKKTRLKIKQDLIFTKHFLKFFFSRWFWLYFQLYLDMALLQIFWNYIYLFFISPYYKIRLFYNLFPINLFHKYLSVINYLTFSKVRIIIKFKIGILYLRKFIIFIELFILLIIRSIINLIKYFIFLQLIDYMYIYFYEYYFYKMISFFNLERRVILCFDYLTLFKYYYRRRELHYFFSFTAIRLIYKVNYPFFLFHFFYKKTQFYCFYLTFITNKY